MRCKNKILAAMLLCILLLFAAACEDRTQDSRTIYVGNRREDRYCEVLKEVLPQYKIMQQGHPATQAFLERGECLVTIDVIAESLQRSSNRFHWYPHSKAAIVIAIDRDKTDESVLGWHDLMASESMLGMSDQFGEFGCIVSAMSYGLDPENLSAEDVVQHLARRYRAGKIKFNDFESPMMVLFDYQAVDLKKHGHNLEIIVPQEGTYLFDRGLLSKTELSFPDNMGDLVIEKGICSLDGSCDENFYPAKKAYRVAAVPDKAMVQNNMIRARSYINRNIYQTHRFVTATAWEYIVSALVAIAVFVLWTGSVQMRITHKEISHALLGIGICMVLWVCVRFVKWQFATDTLANRYLWYSYYIFMLSLSNFFLWLAVAVGKQENKGLMPKWFRRLLLYEFLLLVMVFTNNIHQWVFTFDRASDFWKKEYGYGWGYVLMYTSFITPVIIAVGVLIVKFLKSPKKVRVLLPMTISGAMICFGVLYVMRFPPVWNSDLVISLCTFILLFGESAMRTNLIPVNSRYINLFHNSSLNMSIVQSDGEVKYASLNAKAIPKVLKDKIVTLRRATVLSLGKNTLLYADPITGGNVVWEEDISGLVAIQDRIFLSNEKLEKTNELLESQAQMQAQKESTRAKLLLHEELNKEIGEQMFRLSELVEKLALLEQEENFEAYEKVLGEINFTSIYIKRRCNLMFYVEQERISSDATVTHISELLECGENLGMRFAPVLNLEGEIETTVGILIYDLCFSVLSYLLHKQNSELMLHCYQNNGTIVMLFMCEVDCQGYEMSEKIRAQSGHRVELLFKDLDEVHSMQVTIWLEEGGHD